METLPTGVLIAIAFPFVFAAFWLGVTSLVGWIAGWQTLARRYPDRKDAATKRFTWRSGHMGPLRAGMNNCLNIDVCSGGLRIALPWIFAIPNKPFFVPWEDVQASSIEGYMWDETQLAFGSPPAGTLTVSAALAGEIAAAAPHGKWRKTNGHLARGDKTTQ